MKNLNYTNILIKKRQKGGREDGNKQQATGNKQASHEEKGRRDEGTKGRREDGNKHMQQATCNRQASHENNDW
ncbi:MAG: hypothetical protein LBL13_03645 [Bacteroidales bacterium]|nr:hypothetical protein [Bacteroidales bacterium]